MSATTARAHDGLVFLTQFHTDDELFEVRIVGDAHDGTVSGFFDPAHVGHAAGLIEPYIGRAHCYAVLNPIRRSILDETVAVTRDDGRSYTFRRAFNAVQRHIPTGGCTSDRDIVRRVWLPFDFDPVRAADTASTDEQQAAALERAYEVRNYLMEHDFPKGAIALSGNGAHLLLAVALDGGDEGDRIARTIITGIAERFSDGCVHVDATVATRSRPWKVYGSAAVKGNDPKQHRRSQLVEVPA